MPKPKIRCYDNGGKTADRYTVVYISAPQRRSISNIARNQQLYAAVGMSDRPFHPQGFGQHTTAMPGRHLGLRITFEALPVDCQKMVARDFPEGFEDEKTSKSH